MKSVGVVAIGRNEGERLVRCLRSVVGNVDAVVYVDSGSTDGSASLARALNVEVVDLDLTRPFTAARARNEGFARLLHVAPEIQFVQFIDGDCEVVGNWLDHAVELLAAHPQAGVVCGRRRERFPQASIYNRLCDMEWDTPAGQVKSCGGDAMMRVAALQQVGGYNASVIAGEEPELCVRLRQRGWTIQRIDAEMTLHDAAMTRFSQWWKRNVRAGHAYAEGNAMHGQPPERFRAKEVASNQFYAGLPLWICLSAVMGFFLPFQGGIVAWASAMLCTALYPLMVIKVAISRSRRGDGSKASLIYGFFVMLGKFPQAWGQLKFWSDRVRGKRAGIIEYKSAAVVAKI